MSRAPSPHAGAPQTDAPRRDAPRPEAVVFDIGNVLIEWQPERAYAAMVGADRAQAMFAAVDLHQMNELVDRGADFRETVYAAAEQVPEFGDARAYHLLGANLAEGRGMVRPYDLLLSGDGQGPLHRHRH